MRNARRMNVRRAAVGLGLVGLLLGGGSGAQTATNPYPNMAPLAQYLSLSQEAEVALARSAAPPSISAEAEILAFGPKGYETAVNGTTLLPESSRLRWGTSIAGPSRKSAPP